MARTLGGSQRQSANTNQRPNNSNAVAAPANAAAAQNGRGMFIFDYYKASIEKAFPPTLFVKAEDGLSTVLLVGGGQHQLP